MDMHLEFGTVDTYFESQQNSGGLNTPRVKGRIDGGDIIFRDWYKPKVGITIMYEDIMTKEEINRQMVTGIERGMEITETMEASVEQKHPDSDTVGGTVDVKEHSSDTGNKDTCGEINQIQAKKPKTNVLESIRKFIATLIQ